MFFTIFVSMFLVSVFCYGIFTFITRDTFFSFILFAIVIISTFVLVTQTNIFNSKSLHMSQESRTQFENQLTELTSEEIVKFSTYAINKQAKLDVQLGSVIYVVEYDTIEGIPTVKTIIKGTDVLYDRGVIEWSNEPNKVDETIQDPE